MVSVDRIKAGLIHRFNQKREDKVRETLQFVSFIDEEHWHLLRRRTLGGLPVRLWPISL